MRAPIQRHRTQSLRACCSTTQGLTSGLRREKPPGLCKASLGQPSIAHLGDRPLQGQLRVPAKEAGWRADKRWKKSPAAAHHHGGSWVHRSCAAAQGCLVPGGRAQHLSSIASPATLRLQNRARVTRLTAAPCCSPTCHARGAEGAGVGHAAHTGQGCLEPGGCAQLGHACLPARACLPSRHERASAQQVVSQQGRWCHSRETHGVACAGLPEGQAALPSGSDCKLAADAIWRPRARPHEDRSLVWHYARQPE